MKYFGAGLSESHKELNRIIRKPELIEQTKELFLEIHGKLHLSVVSGNERNEVDELVGDLREDEYAIMPTAKDETIAWVLWHISRIEDLTMNILVNGEKQIFNEDWQTRMNSPIRDTGNALSDNQIIQLSKSLRIQELLEYRNEVGRKSREIIRIQSSRSLGLPIISPSNTTTVSAPITTVFCESVLVFNRCATSSAFNFAR